MVQAGFGRHQIYLIKSPLDFIEGMKWQTIWQPTFIISVILTRISICCFLLRIFNVRRVWRYSLYGIIVFILVTNIPSLVIAFVQCRPYDKSWKVTLPGKCLNPKTGMKIGIYNGVISILIDWVLATLPIAFLWDTKLSRRTKISICVLMSMGYFTGICAIIRTVEFKRVSDAGKLADFSWKTIDLRIWGFLENVIGIIAACIPCLKPLYAKAVSSSYIPWTKSRSRSKSKSSGNLVHHADEQDRQLNQLPKAVDTSTSTNASRTFATQNDEADFNPTESRIGIQKFSRSVNQAFNLSRPKAPSSVQPEEMEAQRHEPRSMIQP